MQDGVAHRTWRAIGVGLGAAMLGLGVVISLPSLVPENWGLTLSLAGGILIGGLSYFFERSRGR